MKGYTSSNRGPLGKRRANLGGPAFWLLAPMWDQAKGHPPERWTEVWDNSHRLKAKMRRCYPRGDVQRRLTNLERMK